MRNGKPELYSKPTPKFGKSMCPILVHFSKVPYFLRGKKYNYSYVVCCSCIPIELGIILTNLLIKYKLL